MTAPIVRIEALRALAALLEERIPALAGHVCTGVAPSSEFETLPNVSIQPTRWRFEPDQANEFATMPGNVLIYRVGDHECSMVLSLVTANQGQRWQLEADILDLFLGSTHPLTGMPRPGVLVLPVTACPQLGQWLASFELDSDEWAEGLALDRRYESRIVLNGIIPALTIARPVYTIDALILGVTEDFSTEFTPASGAPDVELVTINAAGTITRYP